MPKARVETATYLILFPQDMERKEHTYDQPLRWWNSHYKNAHKWVGGRIEVIFERKIKGYDSREYVEFPCPHCKQQLNYHVKAVDGVKGDIRCLFCKGQFGMHPSGQLFVLRRIVVKVDDPESAKKKIERVVRDATHYLDAWVYKTRHGMRVELSDGFSEFESAMENAGMQYRRVA